MHLAEKIGTRRFRTFATLSAISRLMQCSKAAPSFDYLVGGEQQLLWDGETQRLGGFNINRQLVFGRKLYRQISRPLALKDTVDVSCCLTELFSKVSAISDQAA